MTNETNLNLVPLRHKGRIVEPSQLVEPSQWPITPQTDPPRTLKNLSRIIDQDLCHRCGSCVGICPTDVLGLDDDEYPVVENLSACIDCDLCVKTCPGDEFDVQSITRAMFREAPDIKDFHGHFEQAYLSYATDPTLRANSTSGGLVTGLLLSWLERGIIDGAVVIASDETNLWKGKPIIARTPEEILSATKSKYAISPTNKVFGEIRKIEGRYALVGLPCQIHGFHKAARLDKKIRDRVIATIGLFCHAAVEHDPMRYIWKNLGSETSNTVKFVSRHGKHPGTPHLVKNNGDMVPVYFPNAKGYRPSSMEILNIMYRLYTPGRCLTCYDATAEFADIAVGDPWMAPPADDINFLDGYSFALARTERAVQLLEDAASHGTIALRKIEEKTARSSNVMMGEEKRWRAFRVIETRRRQGHGVPQYGFQIPRFSGMQAVKTELNMLSHFFCFFKFGRAPLFALSLSPVGYWLLWLNNKRRIFREWRRDTKALRRRKREKQLQSK